MYPGVIVEYSDQSTINEIAITEVRNKPLFLALFTSDKGTEKWNRVSGKDFFSMYGNNISFTKHGQPLLQAAMSINAGAELLCKRLVASDSTLANIGIVATVTSTEAQKKNENDELLYLDDSGNATTEITDTPYTVTTTNIKYSIKSATNVSTIEAAYDSISATITGDNEYLLYVIADNGRGTSKKRIRIIPNYTLSRSLTYTLYNFAIIEGNSEIESLNFSVNPTLVVNGQNISLQSMINTYSTQLECKSNDAGIEAFAKALAEKMGITDESLIYSFDVLFGCSNKGVANENISADPGDDGIDLKYSYGQILQNGSNGTFGDQPIDATEEWSKQAIEALDGSFDEVIFNLDQYKIAACVDANYPEKVKRAIEQLVAFREDFFYFRDQGLGKTAIDLMAAEANKELKSMFCATYAQSYDIIDPYTKKQISVTIGYDIAQNLVQHLNNGAILPPAGMKYDMVIKNAIYGTLSFTPTVCPDPKGNQKEQLIELGINYASYIDNNLVVETLYTSQEKNSQWSYINNVMGIQEVVRAIRTRCPMIRYSFIDGEDLEKYRKDVEEVIAPYTSNFKTLKLKYVADATYSANKIFYAVLQCVYKDFVQTEWFKIVALPSETTVTE